jgi:hypothetical protein
MKEFLPPLVTPSDEEPIAAGGWQLHRYEVSSVGCVKKAK